MYLFAWKSCPFYSIQLLITLQEVLSHLPSKGCALMRKQDNVKCVLFSLKHWPCGCRNVPYTRRWDAPLSFPPGPPVMTFSLSQILCSVGFVYWHLAKVRIGLPCEWSHWEPYHMLSSGPNLFPLRLWSNVCLAEHTVLNGLVQGVCTWVHMWSQVFDDISPSSSSCTDGGCSAKPTRCLVY